MNTTDWGNVPSVCLVTNRRAVESVRQKRNQRSLCVVPVKKLMSLFDCKKKKKGETDKESIVFGMATKKLPRVLSLLLHIFSCGNETKGRILSRCLNLKQTTCRDAHRNGSDPCRLVTAHSCVTSSRKKNKIKTAATDIRSTGHQERATEWSGAGLQSFGGLKANIWTRCRVFPPKRSRQRLTNKGKL